MILSSKILTHKRIYCFRLSRRKQKQSQRRFTNGRVNITFESGIGVKTEVDLGGGLETGYMVETIQDDLGLFPDGTEVGDLFISVGAVGRWKDTLANVAMALLDRGVAPNAPAAVEVFKNGKYAPEQTTVKGLLSGDGLLTSSAVFSRFGNAYTGLWVSKDGRQVFDVSYDSSGGGSGSGFHDGFVKDNPDVFGFTEAPEGFATKAMNMGWTRVRGNSRSLVVQLSENFPNLRGRLKAVAEVLMCEGFPEDFEFQVGFSDNEFGTDWVSVENAIRGRTRLISSAASSLASQVALNISAQPSPEFISAISRYLGGGVGAGSDLIEHMIRVMGFPTDSAWDVFNTMIKPYRSEVSSASQVRSARLVTFDELRSLGGQPIMSMGSSGTGYFHKDMINNLVARLLDKVHSASWDFAEGNTVLEGSGQAEVLSNTSTCTVGSKVSKVCFKEGQDCILNIYINDTLILSVSPSTNRNLKLYELIYSFLGVNNASR